MRVKLGRNLTFLVTFLIPIAVKLTNVVSHPCEHGGALAFNNTRRKHGCRLTTQTRLKHGCGHWFTNTTFSFQTANLIVLILRHSVGVVILDTDTLWTKSHGIGGSYADSVTVAGDDELIDAFITLILVSLWGLKTSCKQSENTEVTWHVKYKNRQTFKFIHICYQIGFSF